MRYWLLFLILFAGCIQQVAPAPGPDPVTPVDPPAPVVTDGKLRVLILYEEDNIPNLPVSQMQAIRGPEVREWLTSHKADWRIWDQHIDTQFADKFWQDAVKMPHDSLPWIWVTGGTNGKGASGPLPKTSVEVIDLLGRYSK